MTTPHDKALKPCPFCGGEAAFEQTGKNELTLRCVGVQPSGLRGCGPKYVQKGGIRFTLEWLQGKMTENWNRRAPLPIAGKGDDGWQARVASAHHALFHDDPTDVAERRARFFEESNETCQAFGMTREEAHALVDYTYDRPVGDPSKEIGAAMLTLTSLCVVSGHDLMVCAEVDLEKLQRPETIARIRAKRSTRHDRGPLPGFDPAPPSLMSEDAEGGV